MVWFGFEFGIERQMHADGLVAEEGLIGKRRGDGELAVVETLLPDFCSRHRLELRRALGRRVGPPTFGLVAVKIFSAPGTGWSE